MATTSGEKSDLNERLGLFEFDFEDLIVFFQLQFFAISLMSGLDNGQHYGSFVDADQFASAVHVGLGIVGDFFRLPRYRWTVGLKEFQRNVRLGDRLSGIVVFHDHGHARGIRTWLFALGLRGVTDACEKQNAGGAPRGHEMLFVLGR